jgi:non-specific serine/threonine protein kinase
MGGNAAAVAAGGVQGFVPALTSFVGRAGELDEVAGLLAEYRLVTVTGPGGVGKTRLTAEVARRVAGRFADGAWLVELAAVGDAALVPAAVAVALGVHQPPSMSLMQALTEVLARRQLLVVLDNCEHVAAAAAELCAALLPAADDVRVLATSREPLGIGGEARYRLAPLTLPGLDAQGETGGSEAVALFADRARQADPHFELGGAAGAAVARLVARLDGMPLAIELAAARVESLGVAQLLDRLDDRLALLAGGDRLAAPRQRSLAATVEWSYRLLGEDERRVFRALAVFPGPFTLDAAEQVAGAGAGTAVLHLVDCSLLTPPRAGPDGRSRYLMLETLRAYGRDRLAEAAEQPGAAAALAGYALQVAEQAAADMQASAGELAAARWLDAEDATTQQALAWALGHDRPVALRLAVALSPWWQLRGRWLSGYALLRAAAEDTAGEEGAWGAAQLWLSQLSINSVAALGHCTAACDALAARGPSAALIEALAFTAGTLRNLDRVPEAVQTARRALALAWELGYPAGEALALKELSYVAHFSGDIGASLDWAQQACQIDPASIPGPVARRCVDALTLALMESGEVASARRCCADGLAQAREAGDLLSLTYFLETAVYLDLQTGHMAIAGEHLREALEIASQIGARLGLANCLDACGHLCAATQRWADAITMWSALAVDVPDVLINLGPDLQRRQETLQKAGQILGPAQARAAEERGKAMSLQTAVEFAAMITAQGPQTQQLPPGLGQLSGRERELVTLVAQGRTDAQIAGQLYISVSTVRSHLDRIRDKTGSRRRADLTRLALQAGLV